MTASAKVPPEHAPPRRLKPWQYAAPVALLLAAIALGYAFIGNDAPQPPPSPAAPGSTATSAAAGIAPAPPPAEQMATAGRAAPVQRPVDKEPKQGTPPARGTEIQATKAAKAPADETSGTGTVTIAAQPWGHVLVDGKKTAAVAPVQGMQLPAGRHEIALENPNVAEKRSVVVVIRSNKMTKISCTATGCKAVN